MTAGSHMAVNVLKYSEVILVKKVGIDDTINLL